MSQTSAHSAATHLKAKVRRVKGRDVFSLVTGKGRRPSSSDGLVYRFSLRLLRDGTIGEERVEPADEVERLVFLRSRMFTSV